MRLVIGFGFSAILTAAILWLSLWSPMAKDCFAKGGTNFDPLMFSCTKIVRI